MGYHNVNLWQMTFFQSCFSKKYKMKKKKNLYHNFLTLKQFWFQCFMYWCRDFMGKLFYEPSGDTSYLLELCLSMLEKQWNILWINNSELIGCHFLVHNFRIGLSQNKFGPSINISSLLNTRSSCFLFFTFEHLQSIFVIIHCDCKLF